MGIKAWLKEKLFLEISPEFSSKTRDRKIYDLLSEPKTCKQVQEELGTGRRNTYNRISLLMERGLVKKNGDTYVKVEKGPSIRLRPRLWLNAAGIFGLLVALPLDNGPLALCSMLYLVLNMVSL